MVGEKRRILKLLLYEHFRFYFFVVTDMTLAFMPYLRPSRMKTKVRVGTKEYRTFILSYGTVTWSVELL